MSRRDSAWLVLTVILLGGAYLLWPILFSLKVDGNTSMSWAAVWTPLWVADGIGEDNNARAAPDFTAFSRQMRALTEGMDKSPPQNGQPPRGNPC